MIAPPNNYIEHTLLKPDLTDKDIDQLVVEAKEYGFLGICVPPFWVEKAERELNDSRISLITVIGFPFGYQRTESKLKEMELAISDGADELDLVMNISAFKSDMSWPKIEMAKCAKLAHDRERMLKVIVETSSLTSKELIELSKIVSDSGADFIKTSTGFGSRGASLEDIAIMKKYISPQTGIKASGGIKTLADLKHMVAAGADRIGTSSGLSIMKEYQNE